MALRTTHTYAELELSQSAYDEIAGKLKTAGYHHAFTHAGPRSAIDMTGIGVTCSTVPDRLTPTADVRPKLESWSWRDVLGLRGPTMPTEHEIEQAYRRAMEDAALLPQREAVIAARNEAMAEINKYRGPF